MLTKEGPACKSFFPQLTWVSMCYLHRWEQHSSFCFCVFQESLLLASNSSLMNCTVFLITKKNLLVCWSFCAQSFQDDLKTRPSSVLLHGFYSLQNTLCAEWKVSLRGGYFVIEFWAHLWKVRRHLLHCMKCCIAIDNQQSHLKMENQHSPWS